MFPAVIWPKFRRQMILIRTVAMAEVYRMNPEMEENEWMRDKRKFQATMIIPEAGQKEPIEPGEVKKNDFKEIQTFHSNELKSIFTPTLATVDIVPTPPLRII